jgi:hypothetical protein
MLAQAAGTLDFDAWVVPSVLAALADMLNASAIADASAQEVNVFIEVSFVSSIGDALVCATP